MVTSTKSSSSSSNNNNNPANSKTKAKTNAASSSSSSSTTAKKQVASAEEHLEVLTEHFGFSPKIILERLGYLSNEHLYRIGEGFESFALQCLLEQLKASPQEGEEGTSNKGKSKAKNKKASSNLQEEEKERIKLEAESGVHSILTLFENALDHTIDTFELLLFKSVFGITKNQAENLVLNHHKGLDLRSKERREIDFRRSRKEAKRTPKGKEAPSSDDLKVYSGVENEDELDLETFSRSLDEKERSLRRRINAAKATRSTLTSALTLSERRLSRINQLHSNFSLLLGNEHIDPSSNEVVTQDFDPSSSATLEPIEKTVPLSARKLRADSIRLLNSLKDLRELNPLGESLDKESLGGHDEEVEKTANEVPWSNREDYIQWNSNKVTNHLINQKKEADSSSGSVSGSTDGLNEKRKSLAGMKRGREITDEKNGQEEAEKKRIGKLEDLESLSAKLSQQK